MMTKNTKSRFLEDDLMKYSKWTVVQMVSLLLISYALVRTISIPVLSNKQVFGIEYWKWEFLLLVLICGRLVSGWVIRVIVFYVELDSRPRKRDRYFVYGPKYSVQNCVWLGLGLISWQCVFGLEIGKITNTISVWVSMGAFVWLLKTLQFKVLASSFYVSAYFDRIQESLFNQYVIETLSGPPVVAIKHGENEEMTIEEMTIEHLQVLNQKNVSAWTMKRLMKTFRNGFLSSTIVEQIQGASGEEETSLQIAKKIFCNVSKPGSEYIHLDDLVRFMREDEALKSMRLFEGMSNETEGISEGALKNWVSDALQRWKFLALTLKDIKQVIKQLNRRVNLAILSIVMVSVLCEIVEGHFLLQFLAIALLLTFILDKSFLGSIRFIFIHHPYDVGDRCLVDNQEIRVEKIDLFNTHFLLAGHTKLTYPNFTLLSKRITNNSRNVRFDF